MAFLTATNDQASVPSFLASPFASFFSFLVRIGESSGRGKAVERLGALSDADLEEMGTDREAEVRKIFGAHFHL